MYVASIVVIANLLLIGALPRIFFRRDGELGAMWWVTGAPFFATGAALIGSVAGVSALAPVELALAGELPAGLVPALAALLSLASVGLIGFTLGTHRVPLALWHQHNDAPVHIVTWGAYRRIRHPFYTSFLMTQLAGALILPHPITLAALLYAIGILGHTARREEGRLLASSLGDEYRSYMTGTGRFVPGLGRLAR